MLEPLIKTRLYEEIVKQIIEKIKSGELKPGDRLPTERDLVVHLNVSRTAIREALRSLKIMGLIDSKVGSGTFIKEMTLDSLMDSFASVLSKNERLIIELIEVRMLLEVEIAKLAVRRIDENKIRVLGKTLLQMENEIKEGGVGIKGCIKCRKGIKYDNDELYKCTKENIEFISNLINIYVRKSEVVSVLNRKLNDIMYYLNEVYNLELIELKLEAEVHYQKWLKIKDADINAAKIAYLQYMKVKTKINEIEIPF